MAVQVLSALFAGRAEGFPSSPMVSFTTLPVAVCVLKRSQNISLILWPRGHQQCVGNGLTSTLQGVERRLG